MNAPIAAPDPLARAASLSPAQITRLAALEWRSRTSAWPEYIAAGKALTDAIEHGPYTIREWERVHHAAERIVAAIGVPVEPATIGQQAIEQATLCLGAFRDTLDRTSRSYLTRAWRAFLAEDAET